MIKILKEIFPKKVKRGIKNSVSRIQSAGRPKVFSIGFNKTGTTSLTFAMREFGYIIGRQVTYRELIHDWAKKDFNSLINYCKTAQFFQDVPFSKPYTYVVLDHEFPDSKFILTIRDSPEQWYNSLINFHAKLWGKNGRIPTKGDLQNDTTIYKGRAWDWNYIFYNTPENEPYKKEILIEYYQRHNASVKDYFRHRPDDLLVLNVAEEGAYQKLCNFLDIESDRQEFPWKNKTDEVKQ